MSRNFLAVVSFLFAFSTLAQPAKKDSVFLAAATQQVRSLYFQRLGEKSHLYNGTEYEAYNAFEDEFPYLFEDLVDGDLYYDGVSYHNVPLLYDLSTDNVITEMPNGTAIQLVKIKIDTFRIDHHVFIHMNDPALKPGFYDQLWLGPVNLYARREKNYTEFVEDRKLRRKFLERTTYFLQKNELYFTIKSRKGLIRLLDDQKREIKKVIHDEHLKWRRDREHTITRIVEFYCTAKS